jgi:hypothetical protein
VAVDSTGNNVHQTGPEIWRVRLSDSE